MIWLHRNAKRDGHRRVSPGHPVILLWRVQSACLHAHDDRSESLWISHRQICQHLPVDGNLTLFQTVDHTAVSCPVQTGSRVNPGNPETAQVALSSSTIAIHVPKAFEHSFIGPLEQSMAGAKLTFGYFQYLLVMLAPERSSLYTSSFFSLLRTPGRR